MERYGPYTLALNQAVTVTEPTDTKAVAVILANASPYTCTVNVAGPKQWLAPWTVDQYAYTPGALVQVTPILELAGASSDNTLTATYVDPGDINTASYPQTLTSQAIAAAIAGTVQVVQAATSLGSYQYTANGSHTFAVAGVAAFTDLLLAFYGGAPATVKVTGATTGLTYLPATVMANDQITFPFSSLLEPGGAVVTVTYLGTGAGGASTVALVAEVYPTTIKTVAEPGPTAATSQIINAATGPTNAVMLTGSSAASTIRIWAVNVSLEGSAGVHAEIQVATLAILGRVVCSSSSSGNAAYGIPGGLPVNIGAGNLQLAISGSGTAGCSVAYSWDVP